MVTKIVSGKSIKGALHYNEDKVANGEASLLMASGFAADVQDMNIAQKNQRFENLTMLNGHVKTNALHITLNFDSSDKLTGQQYQQIASAFMERIGFGNQPYLVYRHHDAAHPHLHVVTTNIRPDGQRMDTHNIGRTLALDARRELEAEFKLTKAEGRQFSDVLGIKAADPEKANYGKAPTKHTITNIVNAVTRSYKFTSLNEYNAILKQFNVVADRGNENTVMFQKGGLIYSLLDKNGEKVGIPIKASSIYGKPTLANLEKKFEKGKEGRKPFKEDVKQRIDGVFNNYEQISKGTFIEELQKQQLNITFHQNVQGQTYGATFVDNKNKTVFKGSDLGKNYTAKSITERLSSQDKKIKPEKKTYLKPKPQGNHLSKSGTAKTYIKPPDTTDYLKIALTKGRPDGGPPPTPPKKKKKKIRGVHF
ncbi:relaxase/mobilization nuclease domain-containing protein [Mucilaginibacter sp. X4EP1]|uniref:relaxase/mobilization nuclease domain-containing protein n=1 Tax=Mucilaginibacter sp. X4EP1 TaxID=2723092 RepID=UPI0021673D08|nr:relaxase/mobilization nuclease domain-containing protein [Mucilaginibacter sp. X4EP1]MCS3814776.1 hypothetical protein [Mucilaginibacter sp. X4EP1]